MIELINVSKYYVTDFGRHYVFQDVSLVLPLDKSVGVLGPNGAGKSTFLRLLAGADVPSEGRIVKTGRISPPMGLTPGMQSSLTAAENARFAGRIFGMSRDEINDMIEYVRELSDIGKYFDMPVGTYSAGMKQRIAFAINMSMSFDYYLFDEIGAGGDKSFRNTAKALVQQRLKTSKFIITSHRTDELLDICDAGIVIRDGQLAFFDDIKDALQAYGEEDERTDRAARRARRRGDTIAIEPRDDTIATNTAAPADAATMKRRERKKPADATGKRRREPRGKIKNDSASVKATPEPDRLRTRRRSKDEAPNGARSGRRAREPEAPAGEMLLASPPKELSVQSRLQAPDPSSNIPGRTDREHKRQDRRRSRLERKSTVGAATSRTSPAPELLSPEVEVSTHSVEFIRALPSAGSDITSSVRRDAQTHLRRGDNDLNSAIGAAGEQDTKDIELGKRVILRRTSHFPPAPPPMSRPEPIPATRNLNTTSQTLQAGSPHSLESAIREPAGATRTVSLSSGITRSEYRQGNPEHVHTDYRFCSLLTTARVRQEIARSQAGRALWLLLKHIDTQSGQTRVGPNAYLTLVLTAQATSAENSAKARKDLIALLASRDERAISESESLQDQFSAKVPQEYDSSAGVKPPDLITSNPIKTDFT